jgi:hypothetical protein
VVAVITEFLLCLFAVIVVFYVGLSDANRFKHSHSTCTQVVPTRSFG